MSNQQPTSNEEWQALLFKLIKVECDKKHKDWNNENAHDYYWLTLLTKQVGDVATAAVNEDPLEEEDMKIIKVAALIVDWMTDRLNYREQQISKLASRMTLVPPNGDDW